MITLYDFYSFHPELASLSPWVLTVRLILGYKGIPYTVKRVEFGDIETAAKEIGAAPTGTKPDGSPHYTVPFIQDSSNGVVVSDSLRIAKYLDTNFPDTPQVAPADTGSQFLTSQEIMMRLYPMYPLARPSIHKSHSEAGKAVQERMYGLVVELQPEEKVALLEKGKQGFMEVIDRAKGDVYLTGEHPVFIDFVLAAGGLIYRATFGIESAEWKEVASWKDGRWQRVVENMERYIQVA